MIGSITYQDFLKEGPEPDTVERIINLHSQSDMVRTARIADQYDHHKNPTINNYVKTIMTLSGMPVEDFTASNNKIASNFFHRLNTQRCMYSLGNGISFVDDDTTKEELGIYFDRDIQNAAYYALIHGVSFCFWNMDRLNIFPLTEFAPLWDEFDGTLKAGVRYWRLENGRPMQAVLYEIDGYTRYSGVENSSSLQVVQDKRPYKEVVSYSQVDGAEIVGGENYSSLPIVPMWGSKLKQSTLIGMREAIDSYDLIRSGFANDLTDVSQVYWLIKNAGGMTDADVAQFRDRLKITHIGAVYDSDEADIEPYSQEIPYQARKEYLDSIRAGIYEDFGGLDVHTIAAGATNDHIDAAYQPMDEEADDFEYQVADCIMQICRLQGIDAIPEFKRNRISNQYEIVQMVAMEAQWLDQATILSKLPNLTPDEVKAVLDNAESEEYGRLVRSVSNEEDQESDEDGENLPVDEM